MGRKFEITFYLSWLAVGALTSFFSGVVLCLVYTFGGQNMPATQLVASMLLGTFAIAGALSAIDTSRSNFRREQQKAAFGFLDSYSKFDVYKIKDFLTNYVVEAGVSTWDGLLEKIGKENNCTELQSTLEQTRTMLGVFEDIAIAIHDGYADETVLYRSIGAAVPSHMKNAELFLKLALQGYTKDGTAALKTKWELNFYSEAKKLAHAWERSISYSTGKRLFEQ